MSCVHFAEAKSDVLSCHGHLHHGRTTADVMSSFRVEPIIYLIYGAVFSLSW